MNFVLADVVSKMTNEYKSCANKVTKLKSILKKKNARILSLEAEVRNINYTLDLYVSKFGYLKDDDDDETKSDTLSRLQSQTL